VRRLPDLPPWSEARQGGTVNRQQALAIGGGVLATGALVVGLVLAVPDVEGEVTGSAGPATVTETQVSTTATAVTRTTTEMRSAPQKPPKPSTVVGPERTVTVTRTVTKTITKSPDKPRKKRKTPKDTTTTRTSAPSDPTSDPPPPCSPPLCRP